MEQPYNEEAMEGMRDYAKYIAIVIRNAMGDLHYRHLSDVQMEELNPVVKNAVCTAIYAFESRKLSRACEGFGDFHLR